MYKVVYDAPDGVRDYCVHKRMDHDTAVRVLALFKRMYENEDGTPKAYPNGKGYYPFANPRIVSA